MILSVNSDYFLKQH